MQLKGKNLCDFCFEPLEQGGVCAKCGLTHENYQVDAGILSPGTVLIGKYVVGKILGRGGFGATYLAYSNDLDRTVAIKEYLPVSIAYRGKGEEEVKLVSEEKQETFDKGAKRFFEEAKTISKFNRNDNVVSVHEFFYANNTVYYSMELLNGVDLKKYIDSKGGKLSEAEVINIIISLCNALTVIHSAQILHRDIAPDNIFVCTNGKIKLIDFGTAKQVVSDENQSYSVVVKQGFAPAEQYSKKGKQGVWTDIYAVGATAYYSLTGKIPPDAIERADSPYLHIEGENISQEIIAIINKCMQIRSTDRYQSVIDLWGDLDQLKLQQGGDTSHVGAFTTGVGDVISGTRSENVAATTKQKEEYTSTRFDGASNNTVFAPSKQQAEVAPKGGSIFKKKGVMIPSICGLVACIAIVIFLLNPFGEEDDSSGGGGGGGGGTTTTSGTVTPDFEEDPTMKVTFNGSRVSLMHPIVVKSGTTMLSDKDIFAMLGISYFREGEIIKCVYNDNVYSIGVEEERAANGKPRQTDVKYVNTVKNNGTLMLPAKQVLEYLGASVGYDSAEKALTVTTVSAEPETAEPVQTTPSSNGNTNRQTQNKPATQSRPSQSTQSRPAQNTQTQNRPTQTAPAQTAPAQTTPSNPPASSGGGGIYIPPRDPNQQAPSIEGRF